MREGRCPIKQFLSNATAQELVRALYKRPRVVESLLEGDPARAGLPDLAAFLTWLWPLTAAPERHARANAQWLHRRLAALLLAETEPTGAAATLALPPASYHCWIANMGQGASATPVSLHCCIVWAAPAQPAQLPSRTKISCN